MKTIKGTFALFGFLLVLAFIVVGAQNCAQPSPVPVNWAPERIAARAPETGPLEATSASAVIAIFVLVVIVIGILIAITRQR